MVIIKSAIKVAQVLMATGIVIELLKMLFGI